MAKFKVTRPVVVTVTDYMEADTEQEIWDRINNGKSVAGEISGYGIANNHLSVKYEFLDDTVVKVSD